jgi:hypothetical protein
VFAVAQICFLLLYWWTPQGVVVWFTHVFPQLDGRTPQELLAETRFDLLHELAGSG